ncbi:acetyltransferase [Anaerocolumna aminovalerica]|uniref:acetyltransferase n=1 Tax=Anaerocolumna aminovalerica TaxID=1527 RepID=UPI000BE320D4|nr:acetyltransferase [Anaerocolumna aminovalerica]
MSQNRKILLLGAGGHCMSVLDSLITLKLYSDIGIVDRIEENKEDNWKANHSVLGIPVVGTDDDLERLYNDGYTDAFITVGSLGNTSIRRKLYKKIKEIGFNIPNIIDESSIISNFVTLGEGNFIGKKVVINGGISIGNCTIINTSSTIEHESIIDDFVHISPGSILCGNVHIGANTHVGAGSIIKQELTIGSDTIIGMGSVVISDIKSNAVAFGNPCREVKHE